MKLGVSITAFNEKDIVSIIQQYEGIADKIIVAVSEKPWFGDVKADDTFERALTTTAKVFKKDWRTEAEQRNFTMDHMRDMDYVIVSHCDTWLLREQLDFLKTLDLDNLHYGVESYTYWKDFQTVIYPYITLPTFLVRSDAVFTDKINIKDQVANPDSLFIDCYHTSWIGTDEEILKKIQTYSHADEISSDWFENVWKKWKHGDQNFAPTNPQDFMKTITKKMPEEILRRING